MNDLRTGKGLKSMALKVSMVYRKWGKLYTLVISSHSSVDAEVVLLRNMHYLCRKATMKWLLIKTYSHGVL